MQVIEIKPPNRVIAFNPGVTWSRYLEKLRAVPEYDERVWERIRKLGGNLIGQQYAHLSFSEAVYELLAGHTVTPPQVNAWVLALLKAQVRPPQRVVIGSSPKYRLKRRSGHQAREPPLRKGLVRLGSVGHVDYHVAQRCSRVGLPSICQCTA